MSDENTRRPGDEPGRDPLSELLRQLGWTPQRPVGRALERDEAAITEWKTKRWPAIKKKSARRGAP